MLDTVQSGEFAFINHRTSSTCFLQVGSLSLVNYT